MKAERWLPIPSAPGYEASDRGRVRSIDRIVPHKPGITQRAHGRVLKGRVDPKNGRRHIHLAGKNRAAAALVLEAFVGPRPHGLEACHNDGDPANDSIRNLRWDTPESNRADTIRHRAGEPRSYVRRRDRAIHHVRDARQLQTALDERRLTRNQLIRLTELSPATISLLFPPHADHDAPARRSTCSLHTATKIAWALNRPVRDLFRVEVRGTPEHSAPVTAPIRMSAVSTGSARGRHRRKDQP